MSDPKTNPANPDDPIRVGRRVRSLDYTRPLKPDSAGALARTYIEGTVIGFEFYEGCWRYKIDVERRVFDGEDEPFERPWIVIPPVNGTPILGSDHRTSGVTAIDAPKAGS